MRNKRRAQPLVAGQQRYRHLTLRLDKMLILAFPTLAGFSILAARRLARWSNRTRLARDQAEAELYREIVDGEGPGRPGLGA